MRQLGEMHEAAACFRRALESEPAFAEAHNNLGNTLADLGQIAEAIACYHRALELKPGFAEALNNLGGTLEKEGRVAEAIACYRQVLEWKPDFAAAHGNLGNALKRLGKRDEAVASYRRAMELDPNLAEVHNNLGNVLENSGKIAEAITCYRRAVALKPEFAEAHNNLGSALLEQGKPDDAAACYRTVIELQPDHPIARHMLAAVGACEAPARASDAYIRSMFDSCAATFEQRLGQLGYRGPELIATAVARTLGAAQGNLEVLDAGCGTGLCGPILRPYAAHLTGVDLSPGMLEIAAARHVYDRLISGELTAHFEALTESYDLIISADTMVYFGDLQPLLAAAAPALRRGGFLCFTVEKAASGDSANRDYCLQRCGRYAHTEDHVGRALAAAGLVVLDRTIAALRIERGHVVDAIVVVACRQPPA
jgi:predicted TPR repeat methyltransferase